MKKGDILLEIFKKNLTVSSGLRRAAQIADPGRKWGLAGQARAELASTAHLGPAVPGSGFLWPFRTQG